MDYEVPTAQLKGSKNCKEFGKYSFNSYQHSGENKSFSFQVHFKFMELPKMTSLENIKKATSSKPLLCSSSSLATC